MNTTSSSGRGGPNSRARGGRGNRGGRRGRAARGGVRSYKDPSKGWKIQRSVASNMTITVSDSFLTDSISKRAQLFCKAVVQNLNINLRARRLGTSKVDHVVLLIDDVLKKCLEWLRQSINLHGTGRSAVSKVELHDMYRFLAIMLYSHCTGFSFKKTIEIMSKRYGFQNISLTMIQFISNNILAFSPTNRGNLGTITWESQRDQTPQLQELEKLAFGPSCRIFFIPLHSILTLDDDLHGTRSKSNQVKKLSARKADKEGHCSIVVADALFRVILAWRFDRRGEAQDVSVDKTLDRLLENRGELSVAGVTMTADRGFAKFAGIPKLMAHGIHAVYIFPEHLIRCHPFVGASFLAPLGTREVEDNEESADSQSDSSDEEKNSEDQASDPVAPPTYVILELQTRR